jgi:hypothetical protein
MSRTALFPFCSPVNEKRGNAFFACYLFKKGNPGRSSH